MKTNMMYSTALTATEIQTFTVTAPLVATCSCNAPDIQNPNFDGYSNPLYDSTEDILPWTYSVLPPSTLSNHTVEVVPSAYGVETYDGSSLLLVTMPQVAGLPSNIPSPSAMAKVVTLYPSVSP
jgi:hypothetical protein